MVNCLLYVKQGVRLRVGVGAWPAKLRWPFLPKIASSSPLDISPIGSRIPRLVPDSLAHFAEACKASISSFLLH